MNKAIASFLILCVWAVASPTATASAAGDYPNKPVTLILPFAAGNTLDISARIVAEYLQQKHNITLLVTPKPGGSGVPASLEVKNARLF